MQGGLLCHGTFSLKNHIPPIILFLLSKDIKIFFEELF